MVCDVYDWPMTKRMSNDDVIFAFSTYRAPESQGFQYLGGGSGRRAYLGPDGWVYKVGDAFQCKSEVENCQRLYLDSDSQIVFPWAEMVGKVNERKYIVRMELVEGEEDWDSNDDGQMTFVCKITKGRVLDYQPANCRWDNGTMLLLDLGV